MTNSGPENSIKITDDIFEAEKERVYLELFERTTNRALDTAELIENCYHEDSAEKVTAELLELLGDIEPAAEADASMKQGATYKQLAYIGHLGKIDSTVPDARTCWYNIAEEQGLTKRHAGHIIARLNEISQGTAELEEYVNNAGC